MNILVLVKEVPDMQKVKFDIEKGVVNRASAPAEINPFDLNAIQAALEIKAKNGGEMTALTMGPLSAANSLRDCYARGADRVVLLSDRKFGGADTLATSMTLAAGINKIGNFDLIITGEKSVDGDTAQVGSEVAEMLKLPHASYVDKIDKIDEKDIVVHVSEIGGKQQIKTLRMPALISVTKNICTPKLPTVDRKLKSLEIEVDCLTFEDLSECLSEEMVGGKGSPTKVRKIEIQKKPERTGVIFKEDLKGFLDCFEEKMEVLGIGS